MTKLPIILDDFIDEEYQNFIEDLMFDCSWKFAIDNISGNNVFRNQNRKFVSPKKYKMTPGFLSNLYEDNRLFKKIIPLIEDSCKEISFKVETIQRCFAGIHAISDSHQTPNEIHVNKTCPHLVMLYYVNNCDGDTIFYDKTINDIPKEFHSNPEEYCELKQIYSVTPKRGRVLFFDGSIYHAAVTPTKNVRCIITSDLFGEFLDGSYKFPFPKCHKKINYSYR